MLETLDRINTTMDKVIQEQKGMADAARKLAETMQEIRKRLERKE